MVDKILVTYASRTGVTAGVAEAIGKTMTDMGLPTEVRSMKEVTDMSPYRAVIAGIAIQSAKWLPEAMQFLQTHRPALAAKPFAAFLVCMTLAMRNGEKYRDGVSAWLAPVREIVHPMHEGLFAGALDIRKIPGWGDKLKFRLSVLFGVWREGDHRDWPAIRAWAEEVGRGINK
ncbi:MAG TPA: flavodoxin domain-containing protein [bacterium]|nr:flavodoxin domain-containing protein [bacterium]HPN44745.1 flavodoxin domain-containing protein [bacterium]